VCTFLLSCRLLASSGSPISGDSVSISLEKSVVSQDEPVLATIRIENRTPGRMDLDLGGDGKDNLLIRVTDSDGIQHEGKRDQPRGSSTFFGNVHLESGERFSETIVLSEWFHFDGVGRYKIEVRIKTPLKTAKHATPIRTSSLALDVTPKDSRQLMLSCENLLSRIQAMGSAQDALAAATALGLVRDPVVVPFWKQLLTNPAFGQRAAFSLAQIGNKDAVEALAGVLHSTDAETHALAQSALRSLASQTSDTLVRAEALNALDH
jgi:HEAT repeat protein